ncbi:ER degradation-enhancing alpha-mannosidase-like protein 2 [Anopheles bellator]|uniref:ER degradation-enhancing alpha-mannosidase-like protein 2 n=1 Tax=Anopheles bellator TaxID=139047 RepID=UPI002648692B|nr:ER degradation-enhancing alpha-mannosidase-like protein 2 [Anopheles bellator]
MWFFVHPKCNLNFFALVWCCFCLWLMISLVGGVRKYSRNDMQRLRERVRRMFEHAYDGYLRYGAPYDELRPLSCDGIDTWGSYSLTLIDALDTLSVMGNYTEFGRVVKLLHTRSFDADINVSVFETNIRIVGGLLSAHLLSHQAGLESLEPGWPCAGRLLQMAEDVAQRLLPAFDTPTGMPFGTVNLRHGVPPGETPVTCTAGIGTFVLEFGTLSRLTGNPIYENVAMNALAALYDHRSAIGLYGNHIDVLTGRWIAQDAGIGAGVDSYLEYLVKGSILLENPAIMDIFQESKASIDHYLKRDDWYVWVSMTKGHLTLPVFQSLEAYWPGLLSLYGSTAEALRVLHSYQAVWRQYGFLPEFYNIPTRQAGTNRENYPLRPELIESVMYLYRSTGDPCLLEVGENILKSIEHSAKTACGYATIRNVQSHQQEDRMESFFLAETTKYLYLLFDPHNFIHNNGRVGSVVRGPNAESECVFGAGGYIFNTEAHPIDPMALRCCEARHSNYFAGAERRRGDIFLSGRTKSSNSEVIAESNAHNAHSAAPAEEEQISTINVPSSSRGTTTDIGEHGDNNHVATQSVSSSYTSINDDAVTPAKVSFTLSGHDDDESVINSQTVLSMKSGVAGEDSLDISSLEAEDKQKPEKRTIPLSQEQSNKSGTDDIDTIQEDAQENNLTTSTLLQLVQNMFRSKIQLGRSAIDKERFYQTSRDINYNNSAHSIPVLLSSYAPRYDILTCRAQAFLNRIMLLGEFY